MVTFFFDETGELWSESLMDHFSQPELGVHSNGAVSKSGVAAGCAAFIADKRLSGRVSL